MDGLSLDQQGVVVACPQCGQKNRITFERLGHASRCPVCKAALSSPAAPIEVDSTAHFDQLVAGTPIPVVVDFWAPWCGPCRMVAPELQKVAARQAGRFLVVKVNTDELMDLGQRYGIRSIPTMAVFAGGQEIARTSGARPAADIEAFVEHAAANVKSPR
jgi:thioredoxin 2